MHPDGSGGWRHDSLAEILGVVNEWGIAIEEIYLPRGGAKEGIRIASFIPRAAIRMIMLRE